MTVRVVLQSRLTSSRLPAKAMLSVEGMPAVLLAARRAANTGLDVTIATSDTPDDDVIAAAAVAAGIDVARGSLDDPLARFISATEDMSPTDIVVRLTGDNTFPDGAFVGSLVEAISDETPYVLGGANSAAGLPYGVAGEAFTVGVLREAHEQATSPHEREHVTPWVRERYTSAKLQIDNSLRWGGLRCTLDTFEDYIRICRVFQKFDAPVAARWQDLADELSRQENRPNSVVSRASRPVASHQSRIILGTAQLGLPYGATNVVGMPSEATAGSILQEATRFGITHVDTARAYGESEIRIGRALRRGLSEHLSVVTKLRPLADVAADAASSWGSAAARASMYESLAALGCQSVDALLAHRAADWFKPGVRESLLRAKEHGIAQKIGASLSTPEELEDLLTDPAVEYLQFPFNLADRRWLAPTVQSALARRPEVVVTTRSAFLQGMLVTPELASWPHNVGISRSAVTEAVDELVRDLDRMSRLDLALAYVLGQDWIDSAVIGAESASQLAELAVLTEHQPLTDEERRHVETVFPVVSLEFVDPSRWENK